MNKSLFHSKPNLRMVFFNNVYNKFWILLRNLDAKPMDLDKMGSLVGEKLDSNGFMVCWLRNIDRLVKSIPEKENISKLNFVDVGTGTGISAIYAAARFKFNKIEGFDFEPTLIHRAKSNSQLKTLSLRGCNFYVANAAEIKFSGNERSLFFIANSFGTQIMQSFIQNNLNYLIENRCYFAISNDHLANYLIGVPELKMVWRNSKYNCSLFGVR
jgi:Methyltransferase domain